MKIALQNIIAISLAVLVMFSTFSFTVSKHYCGSFLIDSSMFTSAKTCGMESSYRTIPNALEATVQKLPCCKDELILVSGQDELKNSSYTTNLKTFDVFQAFSVNYHKFVEPIRLNQIFYSEYSPPVIVRNFSTWFGSFLI
ncbi:hypothetical protein ACE939_14930 [Aquimarina sp. W85]|uniref:HYC_CC_PP family protein n=1 Tax=Aquimarina rhodophyticola TaxID=3342246 RepID=UPI00366EB437